MEQLQKIELQKVRDFGDMLNVTFEFLKQNFKLLGKSVLFIAGPALVLAGIAVGYLQSSLLSSLNPYDQYEANPLSRLSALLGQYAVTSLIAMLASTFMIAAIIAYIKLYKERGPVEFTIDDVWEVTRSKLVMVFLTTIGVYVVVLLGFILLVVPGMYFTVTLSIIYMARAEEGLSFWEAIRRCMELMRGRWWPTFGFYIVLGAIISILSIVFAIPQYIIMFIIGFNGLEGNSMGEATNLLLIISTAITQTGTYLLYSIATIAMCINYYNLVERKEAPSLLEKIGNIGAQPQQDA